MSSSNSRPAGRVYAPDSSPAGTARAMSGLSPSSSPASTSRFPTGSGSGSSSRLHSAMQGNKSTFGNSFANSLKARSQHASGAGSSSSNGHQQLPVRSTIRTAVPSKARLGSPVNAVSVSKGIPNIDRFRYSERDGSASSGSSRRSIHTIDDSDSSDAEANQPAKKRKFRRGQPPAIDDSPVKPIADVGLSVSGTGPEKEKEGRVNRIREVIGDDISPQEVRDALDQCDQNVKRALSLLSTRKEERGRGSKFPIIVGSSSSSSSVESSHIPLAVHNGSIAGRQPTKPLIKATQSAATSRREGITIESDEDSDGGYSSEGANERDLAEREAAAVRWFNNTAEDVLSDTIGCTLAQAKIVSGLRPFDDAEDAEARLKSTKGVTGKLFTDYVEIVSSFEVVDKVLKKCEARSNRLEAACEPGAIAKDPYYLHEQPAGMDVVLKDYQLEGVNWLSARYRNETSCILADDMGTGKTCQVIAMLCDLKNRGVKGVNLVVAPSSTIENWSRELKRFGPSLNAIIFVGSQLERREIREDIDEDHDDLDVVLTSYNNATSKTDAKWFKRFSFNACIFDEGHQLKNQNTNNYRVLMQVRAQWRLLLTGTPLQNNLLELMSLLNFIMPADFKGASEALTNIFKTKAGAKDSELSKSRVDRAKRMMLPFVLRRLKDKVLSLPAKNIIVEYCDMTASQSKIYTKILARTQLELLGQDEESSASKKKKDTASNILMRLRKGAIHPLLFRTIYTEKKIAALVKDYVKEPEHMDANMAHLREDFGINSDCELSRLAYSYPATQKHQLDRDAWLNSGKILTLKRLIADIKARGEKLVIFSQFEMALFLLMSCLDVMGFSWIAFSGSTKVEERQHVIDEFQTNPDITCFLLTTKAGGVGVNLTAANWVIMLDQDFNPQNDKQAEDRCWRIGQDKEVNVIKLISRGTIDEDILALGQRKLELAARVSGMESGGGGGISSRSSPALASLTLGGSTELGISNDDMDDSRQQEKVTQTLMSKLRSKAQEKSRDEVQMEEGADVDILHS